MQLGLSNCAKGNHLHVECEGLWLSHKPVCDWRPQGAPAWELKDWRVEHEVEEREAKDKEERERERQRTTRTP